MNRTVVDFGINDGFVLGNEKHPGKQAKILLHPLSVKDRSIDCEFHFQTFHTYASSQP